MSTSVVAKRYAVAMFQLAKEKNELDSFEQALQVVKHEMTSNKELSRFLQHPGVPKEKKKEVLREVFANFREEVINFLFLLVDRHRQNEIAEIVDDYVELANEERGIADAIVTTVRPLTQEEQGALIEVFAKKVNKKTLRVRNIVNPDILGGVKIRIGNTIFDGSLKGKLDKIQRHIVTK
ncbi:MAG: F0F1 ATP synthase subunit delta [Bacillaceae bacterium]